MNGWLIGGLIAGAVIMIAIISWVVRVYNFLIYNRVKVDERWSHIEVALKRKYDTIPALAESVKGYTKHESDTLKEVTGLRSQWGKAQSVNEKVNLSNALEGVLGKLMVVVERYPQLKADRNFKDYQGEIKKVERDIKHERKEYNRRVSKYNRRISYFPNNVIALAFGFRPREFFSMEA
jgi:LemA protein